MLKVLTNAAEEQVKRLKYRLKPQKSRLGEITFVQQRGKVPIRKRVRKAMELQSYFQWEVAADLKSCKEPFAIPAAKKPDLVIWNMEEKEAHLVELTVPHEDNIKVAHEQKDNRYQAFVEECKEAGWKATHSPVKVECRGFIASSTSQ